MVFSDTAVDRAAVGATRVGSGGWGPGANAVATRQRRQREYIISYYTICDAYKIRIIIFRYLYGGRKKMETKKKNLYDSRGLHNTKQTLEKLAATARARTPIYL